MTNNKIHCPNCSIEIDVNDLLYHELNEKIREEYQTKTAKAQAKLKSQQDDLKQKDLNLQKAIDEKVTEKLVEQKAHIKKKLEGEQLERISSMQKELDEKSKQVMELNKAQSEIERLKREQSTLRSAIELETEKKFSQQLATEKSKIQQQVTEQESFKDAEKEQVIQQLRNQLIDAQRKAEQGSTQLQGEVQELAIEEWLRSSFPLDDIEEIKKGAHGADCLQVINTQQRQECGSIYYESKRTKSFQPAWIEKFKNDIQQKGADVGVLVTQSMPADMKSLGQIDGVWVCSFEEFKNLSQVLRQSLVEINQALITQENKGDKMGMLYDFLTGNEFRMQIEAIVEGFTQLKLDLESEKRSMQSLWKKREKQIDRVLLNTNFMYSSVKGIAGNAVQSIALLELDENDEVD